MIGEAKFGKGKQLAFKQVGWGAPRAGAGDQEARQWEVEYIHHRD